jgi:hypothetical protein
MDRADIPHRANSLIHPLPSLSSPMILLANDERYYFRGLDLYVWSGDERRIICLCPLIYYSSRCQYENQRISLTIQFLALSQSYRTLFTIVI